MVKPFEYKVILQLVSAFLPGSCSLESSLARLMMSLTGFSTARPLFSPPVYDSVFFFSSFFLSLSLPILGH